MNRNLFKSIALCSAVTVVLSGCGNSAGGDATNTSEPVNVTAESTASPEPTSIPEVDVHIEVEDCVELEGAGIQDGGEASGKEFGGVKNGGYAKYDDIYFGETGFDVAVMRAGAWGDGDDRQVEVRIDAEDGQVIGICNIDGTGDWSNYESFECGLFGNVTGMHDVYLCFKGDELLYNLNWFELKRTAANDGAKELEKVTLDKVKTGMTVEATVSPADATVHYAWYVDGILKGTESAYTTTPLEAGRKLKVEVMGYGDYTGLVKSASQNIVFRNYESLDFDEIAYEAFSAFNKKYYTEKNGVGKLTNNFFWDYAEMYEVVIDAYEHTGEERYKEMIDAIYKDFTEKFQEDWEWNEYNDDIMWMVIACTRAYMLTGEQHYLDVAKANFDTVYEKYVDEKVGNGTGMWWRKDMQTKNACVNGPAGIAASLLGEATGDITYYDKAKLMTDWVVNNLFENGKIWDHMDVRGNKQDWNFTYNQGTFVGAATLLSMYYDRIGDTENAEMYMEYAQKAVDFTVRTKYKSGIVSDEGGSRDIDDCHGFKGIMTRWFYLYAVKNNQPDVMKWMRANAANAWSNRNSEGIIWTTWGQKAEDKDYFSFGASTGVALLHNIICIEDIVKEGLEGIEAEDFNTCSGIVLSEDDTRVASIKNDYYTIYRNVDFGENGAVRAIISASTAQQGGKVEIRLDNKDGKLLGEAAITNTGSFDVVKDFICEIEKTSGMHDICLVFKGEGNFLFELDKLSFSEEALDVTAASVETDDAAGKVAITKAVIPAAAAQVGTILEAQTTPDNATVNYEWYVGADGQYELKGVHATYKITLDDVGKEIYVKISGYGDYTGSADSNVIEKVLPELLDAYRKMEAEACDENQACGGVGGGGQLDGLKDYAHAVYKNVNFGIDGPAKFKVKASSDTSGGTMSVWVDGKDADNNGTLLGQITIANTGGWSKWQDFECELAEVAGVHDVYLVFEGSGYLFNVDCFEFVK